MTMRNFLAVSQTIAELVIFFNMAIVRHLGFVVWMFEPSTWILGGLYRYARFGWNQCSASFFIIGKYG